MPADRPQGDHRVVATKGQRFYYIGVSRYISSVDRLETVIRKLQQRNLFS